METDLRRVEIASPYERTRNDNIIPPGRLEVFSPIFQSDGLVSIPRYREHFVLSSGVTSEYLIWYELVEENYLQVRHRAYVS